MKNSVTEIRVHAESNYNNNGWDNIVECFSDSEIVEFFVDCESLTACDDLVKSIYGNEAVADRCGMSDEDYARYYTTEGKNEMIAELVNDDRRARGDFDHPIAPFGHFYHETTWNEVGGFCVDRDICEKAAEALIHAKGSLTIQDSKNFYRKLIVALGIFYAVYFSGNDDFPF